MEKFHDLEYKRPDFDKEEAAVKAYVEKLKTAQNAAQMKAVYQEEQRRSEEFATMQVLVYIRGTINTADKFYEEEQEIFNRRVPALMLLYQEADQVILQSPYREEFANGLAQTLLADMEINQKLASKAIVDDMALDAKLAQEYSKITAGCSSEFHGKTCNFYQLMKYMQDTDRTVRKEAFHTWADMYASVAPQLDEVYDQMVKLHDKIAKKQGFDNYIDYAYASLRRYDYTPDDVARFRAQVKKIIVPLCEEQFAKQKDRLGVDTLYYYDESLFYPEGNAIPQGTPKELVEKAQQMYRELSPQTGEFFDFMKQHELFDLETKQGKSAGGYCHYLPGYQAPFIFANFNGTSGDVYTLTHEAGHAFQAYESGQAGIENGYIFPTHEAAEIHSMSMEMITYPWMELFFGEHASKYRQAHFSQALTALPALVCIDEYQHKVFEHPEMSPKERHATWSALEKEYMPWRNYDGHEFLEAGGLWMQKQHIFLYPFYCIEYVLAQLSAFEFFIKFRKNREEAWKDYCQLCRIGGNYGYFHMLEMAGLSNPFAEGTVEKIMNEVKQLFTLQL